MRKNALKEKLDAGKRVFGAWSNLSSPTAINVLGETGLDFCIIDMEHGPTTFQTAENQLFAAEAANMSPIIRLGEGPAPHILHALDIGAQSILVSQVSTVEQAKQIADACYYMPEGNRGLSPFTRNHSYSEINLKEKMATANKQMFVGVLVEGEEGVRNIPEIAKVKGLHMIYIGIYDLSMACGVPGELTHPKVLNVMKEYAKIIEGSGLVAGSVAPDLAYMQILFDCGFRFVSYRADSAMLRDGYASALRAFSEISESRSNY